MSKKRGRSKQQPVQVQAVPEEFLAEGSGPVRDIEVISGIQPADASGADVELTAIGDHEMEASGAGDGAVCGDGEVAAQGHDAAARTKGMRARPVGPRSAEGGQLAVDGDGDQADGDRLAADGDGDPLTADGDGGQLTAGGEPAAHGDGAEPTAKGRRARRARLQSGNGEQRAVDGSSDGQLAADGDGGQDAADGGGDGQLAVDGGGDGQLAADGDNDQHPADGGQLTADGEPAADGDGNEPTAKSRRTRRARLQSGDGEQLAVDGSADGQLAAADGDHGLAADGDDGLAADGDDGLATDGDDGLAADGDDVLAAQGGEIEVVDGDVEGEAAAMPTSAASMDAAQLKQLVEALVFASDKPITVQRLRQLTRVSDVARLEQTLVEIATDYADRGLVLQQVSGGYQFRTRPQFSAWVQQLIAGRPVRLSRAQLETLAIIAYRQPITRPEIDDIRGVDSSATLKLLMDRLLIRVLGKKEEVGRPMLYGTTREFLDFFSLGDLRELPTLREYSELSDESRKVMSSRLGIGLDGSEGGEGGEGGGSDDGGDDNGGGGSSGSGGSSGGDGGGGGGFDDLGDLGDPANLEDRDGGGDPDVLSARSLSDLAAHVLAKEASDDETTMFAADDASDEASDDLVSADADGASSDDSMSADVGDGEPAMFAGDDASEPLSADANDASSDDVMSADAGRGETTMFAGDDASEPVIMDADDAARDEPMTADASDASSDDAMSSEAGDGETTTFGGDAASEPLTADASDDEEARSAHAADAETVDAETRQVTPIIVEDVDLDTETRDLHPVAETMTLADAPELERSETRIVDPLIAAEVLAHVETNVSSGDSLE